MTLKKCPYCGELLSEHETIPDYRICPTERGDGNFGDDYDVAYDVDGYPTNSDMQGE